MQAASDLKALAHLIPATARLQLDPGVAPGAKPATGAAPAVEYLQVPTRTVRAGDIVRVLPGESRRARPRWGAPPAAPAAPRARAGGGPRRRRAAGAACLGRPLGSCSGPAAA